MIKQTFIIQATQADYQDAPVWVPLEKSLGKSDLFLADEQQARIPAQQVQVERQWYLVWLEPQLTKGTKRTYRLLTQPPKKGNARIEVVQSGQTVEFRQNNEAVATYVFSGGPKPYVYPLLGPNGKPITRHYPMKQVPGETTDHPHHRSFWFTHGEVNGIDFWSEGNNRGRTVHRRFEVVEGGAVLARVRAVNDWLAPDGKKVCEDVREFRVYHTQEGRLLEFELTLRATEGNVTLGDTKEGTFGIRVACSMEVTRKAGGQIVNARGQRDTDTWGKRAEWCDYTGPVEGDLGGIAIYDHPQNLRHPTYWHVRDYGLFAVNPFGLHDFIPGVSKGTGDHTIKAGDSLTFRYRIWLHMGRTEEAGVARRYDSYRYAPEVQKHG